MTQRTGLLIVLTSLATAFALGAAGACTKTNDLNPSTSTGGSKATGGSATGGSAGAGGQTQSGGATGGSSSGGDSGQGDSAAGGAGRDAAGQTGGATGAGGAMVDATVDQSSDAIGSTRFGIAPPCLTKAPANVIFKECDFSDQSIDFDVAANYTPVPTGYPPDEVKPGYDPAQTRVTLTDFGTAFTGYEVQDCHPYCYKSALTVGIDVKASVDKSKQAEILFDFPMNIASGAGRNTFGWIYLDGPALPAGAKVTVELLLKSTDKGLLVANVVQPVQFKGWTEFKFYPITAMGSGYTPEVLTNITAIGFRFKFTTTADWKGVLYCDHFQLRVGNG